MSLNISKLEKVKNRGSQMVAQCPACFETDHDHKGEHLWINAEGRFGCVLNPGGSGKGHRKRIFQLAGDKAQLRTPKIGDFQVEKVAGCQSPNILIPNVLGHLGHLFETYACKVKTNNIRSISDAKECPPAVPAVPINEPSVDELCYLDVLGLKFHFLAGAVHFEDGTSYTPQEVQCLEGVGAEIIRQIHLTKKTMGGTIQPISDQRERTATK